MVLITQIGSFPTSKPIVHFIRGNYAYVVLSYEGTSDNKGRIRKYNLTDLSYTELYSNPSYRSYQSVYDYINNRLILVGKGTDASGIIRACITLIDLSTDTATTIFNSNTGEVNEFISVALDYANNRLLVGERASGGNTTGSSYPNGGGLWVIPLSTITDPTTWTRVYEDPNNAEWTSIIIAKGQVTVALNKSGVKHVVLYASLSNLTSWTTDITSSGDVKISIDSYAVDFSYAYIDSNNNVVLKVSSPNAYQNFYTITVKPPNTVDVITRRIGRYILIGINTYNTTTGKYSLNLYVFDVNTKTTNFIGTLPSSYDIQKLGVYDGSNSVYYGATGTAPQPIVKVSFDYKRVLTLTPSTTSPAVGQTITLKANLTDGVNPIQGATIEFWQVGYGMSYGNIDGSQIGTATTDAFGNATISWTVPNQSKIWVQAIHRG